MVKPRPLDGGDSFWLEDNPLSALATFDPLRETTAQSRALRKGETFVPFEERQAAAPLSLTPVVVETPAPQTTGTSLALLARANADPNLSVMGLKILLAVLTFPLEQPISLSRFSERTGLSKTGVISGIRNSLDAGYITRSQSCPRCAAALSFTEDKRTVTCPSCKRDVPPQAHYAVFAEDRGAVTRKDSPVTTKDRAVLRNDITPVVEEDSSPVLGKDRAAFGKDSLSERAASLASRMTAVAVTGKDSPVFSKDSPRARGDSESVARIRDSDSRIPPQPGSEEAGRVVYASAEWQQMTEKLAKDSAKRIGDKSVGFHVKVWAHARKVDWEKGGRWFEEGLLAIAQELENKHNATGKSQGAMWTKMVRRYFEEKGSPLLTEAEAEEWKDLHRSYAPPNI